MKPIKRILATTDFSPVSNNALRYAIGLAGELSAKLYILHSYRIPSVSDMAYPMSGVLPEGVVDLESVQEEVSVEMEKLEQEYLTDSSLKYEILIKSGFVEKSITETIAEYKIDLLVMGTRGANALQEIFGSTTTKVISSSQSPLLVIPKTASFQKIDRIILASDYQKSHKPQTYDVLLNFAQLFHAKIDVLHIKPESEKMSSSELEAGEGLNRILKKTQPTFHFHTEGDDVNDAIEKYLHKHENSMLAMVPHKHSLIDRLIHGSKTQHMIFHSKRPMLVMKE